MSKNQEAVESEDFEQKSLFSGSDKEWLGLIKTIVALANTLGGKIEIEKINKVNPKEFDTARLDDKVNSYISPRIQNIIVSRINEEIFIIIPNSMNKPHFFSKRGAYQDLTTPKYQNIEFFECQVWVRHSGKNDRANKDDFDRMFKEKLDEFLKNVNIIANQFPVSAKELRVVETLDSEGATPVQISESGEGLPVMLKRERADPNLDFPYNAKELGKLLNKSLSFIARITSILGLRRDMKYAIQLKNPQGKIIMVKYSNETLDFLRGFLSQNPDFTPYKQNI